MHYLARRSHHCPPFRVTFKIQSISQKSLSIIRFEVYTICTREAFLLFSYPPFTPPYNSWYLRLDDQNPRLCGGQLFNSSSRPTTLLLFSESTSYSKPIIWVCFFLPRFFFYTFYLYPDPRTDSPGGCNYHNWTSVYVRTKFILEIFFVE